MPTANEMFNAYFAPAAADWQKESHLRTNAEARARMQRMEEERMANWKPTPVEPPPAAPAVPMMTSPSPVKAAVDKVAPLVADDFSERLMTAKTVRDNAVSMQAKALANSARKKYGKLSNEDVAFINKRAAELVDSNNNPILMSARSTLKEADTRKAQESARAQEELLMSGLGEKQRAHLTSTGGGSVSNADSQSQSAGGGGVSLSSSLDSNVAAQSLQKPTTDYLQEMMTRKPPDFSRRQAQADFIRSQLPDLEKELMLTGGTEEYRKRLAGIESGISEDQKAFDEGQLEITKSAVKTLQEMGQNARNELKLKNDIIKQEMAASNKLAVQQLKNRGALANVNARNATAIVPIVVEFIRSRTRLAMNRLDNDTRLAGDYVYNNREIDSLRRDQSINSVNSLITELTGAFPEAMRLIAPRLGNDLEEIISGNLSGYAGTVKGEEGKDAKPGYFGTDVGAEPEVKQIIAEGQDVVLPSREKKRTTSSEPTTWAQVEENAKKLPPGPARSAYKRKYLRLKKD